jgi:hypothetical protein
MNNFENVIVTESATERVYAFENGNGAHLVVECNDNGFPTGTYMFASILRGKVSRYALNVTMSEVVCALDAISKFDADALDMALGR